MKKFGFGKKNDDGEDMNRSSLFGSRKKATGLPPSENPYAQQGSNDPYADQTKYANMSAHRPAQGQPLNINPQGSVAQAGSSHGGPPPPVSNARGYTTPPSSGYGNDRYGSGGGYGSNKYDSQSGLVHPSNQSTGLRGPSGYGGFGQPNDEDLDNNRDALFAGAQEKYEQQQGLVSKSTPGASYRQSGAGGGSYGGYGDQRELTAEEREEADVQDILMEKRQVQQESVSSVSRSVQMARQANEVGRATLARLGAQGERLHNTEKNLDLAANQNKVAQDRAAELKTLNGSMFAVHVGNPFTSKQRQARADESVINRHRMERDQRETTRRDGFAANQRMETNMRDIDTIARPRQNHKKDYGKFNLDDEEGADELEDQIDEGIDELAGQVRMMNMVGRAIGQEVNAQNKQIDRIMNKSDAVDDATRMNRERLARIK